MITIVGFKFDWRFETTTAIISAVVVVVVVEEEGGVGEVAFHLL